IKVKGGEVTALSSGPLTLTARSILVSSGGKLALEPSSGDDGTNTAVITLQEGLQIVQEGSITVARLRGLNLTVSDGAAILQTGGTMDVTGDLTLSCKSLLGSLHSSVKASRGLINVENKIEINATATLSCSGRGEESQVRK
ncbi:unnamed protein product, partial [Choristocarpus tenellus]